MKVYENIGKVTDKLIQYFPNTTIYPVLGNHDEYPANNFPATNMSEYYTNILNISGWHKLLSESEAEEFKKGLPCTCN